GPLRLGAVALGFVGVVIMLRPWESGADRSAPILILILPVLAALTYATNQILTRWLGAVSKASAMAVYIQGMFILVAAVFFIVAGDGRYAAGVESASLQFILRAWVWPGEFDRYLFIGLGLNSAVIAYAISQAYRMAEAATVAPFEYVGLPLAIFWGWIVWGDLPGPTVALGILLVAGSGLFVFFRENQKKRRVASNHNVIKRS
ncbi:MAG: hypothetical protein AAF334_02045, partial [Pseudomonadota bacterium]